MNAQLLNLLAQLFLLANRDVDGDIFATRTHDGVLTTHAAVQSALEFGPEGQLAHVVGLFVAKHDALGRKSPVLHPVEIKSNIPDLGLGRVISSDSGSEGWCHAVGAEAYGRRSHDGARRLERSGHCDSGNGGRD